jgi:hypothetical protein
MDKYIGTDTSQKYNRDTGLFEKYRMDMYAPMKQSELEERKWGGALTDVFDVDPKTLKMTPKEGISEEDSKRYFEIIKKNLMRYSTTDNPLTNRIRGATSQNVDPSLTSLGLQYSPETGELIKGKNIHGKANKSLRDVLLKDEATAEFSQLSPYYRLLQSVKEKYKSIQDPEVRTKLETEELSRQVNKDENTRMQMEEFKKNQQKVLDLYKEHIKKFGERV